MSNFWERAVRELDDFRSLFNLSSKESIAGISKAPVAKPPPPFTAADFESQAPAGDDESLHSHRARKDWPADVKIAYEEYTH